MRVFSVTDGTVIKAHNQDGDTELVFTKFPVKISGYKSATVGEIALLLTEKRIFHVPEGQCMADTNSECAEYSDISKCK